MANQKEIEKKLDLDSAIKSAKESLEDIKNGFQKIHIDPSIDILETLRRNIK